MPASHTRNDLLAMIARWRAEIDELERKIAVCTEALRLYNESPSDPADIDPLIAILSGCRTQREALHTIARHNDGIVRARDAAQLIYDAGLSRGKLSSVISTTHNLLSYGYEWERVAPGMFRLIETDEAVE